MIDLASRRRWPNRLLAAAAAVALLGVAGVAAFGGKDDAKDTGVAKESLASDSVGVGDVAGGAPQSTIGSITGSADPRIPINDKEQLRDLLSPVTVPLAAPSTDSGASETTALDSRYATPGSECLHGNQIVLTPIVYQGTLGYAVRDTVTGVTQAIDEQCNVLVEVGP